MSNYHIGIQDIDKKSVNVVFHIPISSGGQNEADLTWRAVVVKEQGGSDNIVSVLSDISPTESTQLKSGEIYEKSETVRFSSINLSVAQRKAEIKARFNNLKTKLIQEKKITLEWIGYKGDA